MSHAPSATQPAGDADKRTGENSAAKTTTVPAGDDAHPLVVLQTNEGAIAVRLNREVAPRTVDAFLHYVESGLYDGTIFHQVLAGQLVLGGGYTPELREKRPSQHIPNEAADKGLKNRRGTIAMARPLEEVNGSTCQFFINLADNPALDHRDGTADGFGFCVFGEVVSGMETLAKISKREVRSQGDFELLPVQTVLIERAKRLR